MADEPGLEFEESSGNVFADLGFPNAGEELVKAELTIAIHQLIRQRGLTQLPPPNCSAPLPTGLRLDGCRAGMLLDTSGSALPEALDQDAEITVPPKAEPRSGTRVLVRAEG